MSLKDLIKNYCQDQYPRIIHKGELGKKAVNEWGYENENMGRRCRELENEGVLKKIPDDKGQARYQYIPRIEVRPLNYGLPKQQVMFKYL